MSVSPARVQLPGRAGAAHFMVHDLGTRPLLVKASVLTLHGVPGKCQPSGAPLWAHVWPASFTLVPGQSRTVTLTVHAPASVTGTTDVAAVFTGSAPGPGNFRLTGSVAGQAVLTLPGKTATSSCVRVAVAAQPTSGLAADAFMGAGAAALLVALAVAVWAVLRRRKRVIHWE